MNFELTFVPDKNYYLEAYGEIISSLKRKRYEPYFASLLIVLGLMFYFFNTFKSSSLFPFALILSGVFGHFSIYNEKKKWLKDRLNSKIAGQTIQMYFSEKVIKHNGPFASGELGWDGVSQIVKTKNGILIKPENGISIYLPRRLFTNQNQIDFVLSKKK